MKTVNPEVALHTGHCAICGKPCAFKGLCLACEAIDNDAMENPTFDDALAHPAFLSAEADDPKEDEDGKGFNDPN